MKKVCIALALMAALAGRGEAASITYVLPDIGTFTGYGNPNTTDTYTGDGFVGMSYLWEVGLDPVLGWAHVFGVEVQSFPDYEFRSRTVGQVDLSGLKGKVVDSATFSFDLLDGCLECTQDVVFSAFVEDGNLDFNWDPVAAGSITASVSDGVNELDVTALVAAFLAGSDDYFAFHLQGTTELQWTLTSPEFGEYDSDSAKVRLTVNYHDVPEPAGVLLLGAGLASGILRRRRANLR